MTTLPPNIPPYGPSLSLADAKRVMDGAEKEAVKNNWPMVIAIVDAAGHLLMLHKMDQAQTGSILIAQKKAETAANFRRSTKIFQDGVAAGGVGLRMLAMPGLTPLEGGIPILREGKVIGAIGVSGMQSDQDAIVAEAGIKAL